jgi:hypothetical protein
MREDLRHEAGSSSMPYSASATSVAAVTSRARKALASARAAEVLTESGRGTLIRRKYWAWNR